MEKNKNLQHNTYLIQDKQGLDFDFLREILNKYNFKEKSREEVLTSTDKFIDLFWLGMTLNNGMKIDKTLYVVHSRLNNAIDGHNVITDKSNLYINMLKYYPFICKKYLIETKLLSEVRHVGKNTILIVKPVGTGAHSGKGIRVITNDKELEEARESLKKFNTSIVQPYITNPLLYDGKKMHLRSYLLCFIGDYWDWSKFDICKIITAKLPYIKSDWTNSDIHDSHLKGTVADKFFPKDMQLESIAIEKIEKQMHNILSHVAMILKKFAKPYYGFKSAFEVYGVDFLITDDFHVYLLEVNNKVGYNFVKYEDEYKFFNKNYFNWICNKVILPVLYYSNKKFEIRSV